MWWKTGVPRVSDLITRGILCLNATGFFSDLEGKYDIENFYSAETFCYSNKDYYVRGSEPWLQSTSTQWVPDAP